MVEGLRLLVVGMGAVYAFLGLLVLAMYASAAFFRATEAWFPEPAPPAPPHPPMDEEREVAVILAAIAAHRARSTS